MADDPSAELPASPDRSRANEPAGEAASPGEVEAPEDAYPPEQNLDHETAARRRAALANIRSFGDPVLRTRARRVERFDDALRDEVRRMGRLMQDAIGIGLAATQVGVLNRVLVYQMNPDTPVWALVNPEIEWSGRELEIMGEGCLSLPKVWLEVERAVHVRVRAQDEQGEDLLIEASGLEARVLQHEIDHLDGVLILDRVSREQRKQAVRTMREAEQAA